jgi:hypothetical protein
MVDVMDAKLDRIELNQEHLDPRIYAIFYFRIIEKAVIRIFGG